MKNELILILDFGGQYKQLIARRVREAKVYSEVVSYEISVEEIKKKNPKGIIITGGPNSVYGENALTYDKQLFEIGIPVLGICYGNQLMAYVLGGDVQKADTREYGKTTVQYEENKEIFEGVDRESTCWMSHTDLIKTPPSGFQILAHTDSCPVAAIGNKEKKLYGVQFHPEVVHTNQGFEIIKNFLYNVCGCKGDWVMSSFVEDTIKMIKEKIGNKKVLCALSGGVDSSVAALLVHKAVGHQLTCIFVDHGLLRKDEGDMVEDLFKDKFDMNIIRVNAQDRFLGKLKGVVEPESKRKIIGEEFIRVFEDEANKLGDMDYLVQGTIYPDVIESGKGHGTAVIKSHHNVGGLPEDVQFELVEPLRDLFKDEVRAVGEEMGIPSNMVWRQPFPGPGLAIRIIGEITPAKVKVLQEADFIFRDEVAKAGLEREIWQYFAVLTNMRSVGVMGDERTYDYTIALRGVTSVDGMTADWARVPYDVLDTVSRRIVNEVGHINRIVYDITSKPPSTIEWE